MIYVPTFALLKPIRELERDGVKRIYTLLLSLWVELYSIDEYCQGP